MKITALKAQIKNPERVSIFVDGKYSFSLTVNEVISQKLKRDLEVTDLEVIAFKKLSSDGKIKARAYEWLLNRPHSTRELKDYFYRKKVDLDLQARLVAEFTKKQVLNNDRFADWSAERLTRKNKSFRAISNELRSKGVDQVTIQSIASRQGNNDKQALQHLIAKLKSRPKYIDQKKLIAHLLSKGFSYSDVKSALSLQEPEQEP